MWGQGKGTENRRLFVGGLPRYRKREEIQRELGKLVDGLTDVILYPSAADKSKNRGFAFAEFGSSAEAMVARYKLLTTRAHLWGKPVCVDWAAPEPQVDETLMATVKVLYVRNLMLTTTEDAIRAHFDKEHPGTVERVKKMKDFAFVHYCERRFALANLVLLNGTVLDGTVIEVKLAKPVQKAPLTPNLRGGPQPVFTPASYAHGRLSSSSSPANFATTQTPTPGLHFTFPSSPTPNPAFELAQLKAQLKSLYYEPSETGPGTPFFPMDISSFIASQKHKVQLLAMQNQLEMEKLRVMEQEQELSAAWARHCSPQLGPDPPSHLANPNNHPNPSHLPKLTTPFPSPTQPAKSASDQQRRASYQLPDLQHLWQQEPGARSQEAGCQEAGSQEAGLDRDWNSLVASSFGLNSADVDEVLRAAEGGGVGAKRAVGAPAAQLSAPFAASSPKAGGRASRVSSPAEVTGLSGIEEATGLSAGAAAVPGDYWSSGSSPSSVGSSAHHNQLSTLSSARDSGFESQLR